MVYIPKNRCTLNLVAANDEWVYRDDMNVTYNGPYWKLYTGQSYTGNGPNDGEGREIIQQGGTDTNVPPNPIPEANYIPLHLDDPDPIIDDENWSRGELMGYLSLTGQNPVDEQLRKIPFTYYPQPTEKDYKLGIFERYFIVKVNENIWKEIDGTAYEKIRARDKKNWVTELWRPIRFMWTIVGTPKKVAKVNKEMITLYEKKAGYSKNHLINRPRRGLHEYLKKDYVKYRMGDTPEDVDSIFLVKKLNNLTYQQIIKVVDKSEYIRSGKNKEWLKSTQNKANENNRSLFEQSLYEANWVLFKEPTQVTEEEPKSKTIWRVSKEMKLTQDRKEKVLKQADYIMLDPNSEWYIKTQEKALDNDRPLYEQAMREAEYVLYSGNPEHKRKVKQKQQINIIVKKLRLTGEKKEWVKEKALYIKSGKNEKWLKKTKRKRRKWNRNNPEEKRTLLGQCFREALWVWNDKNNIPQ